MKLTRLALTAVTLALAAAGCTNNSSKGVNKDQDRPKATPDSRR